MLSKRTHFAISWLCLMAVTIITFLVIEFGWLMLDYWWVWLVIGTVWVLGQVMIAYLDGEFEESNYSDKLKNNWNKYKGR